MAGGSWPREGKKKKTRPDIARRRERQREWEICNRTRKHRISQSDESLYGRETDRDHLRNADQRRNPKTLRGLARALSESALQYLNDVVFASFLVNMCLIWR